jgi:SAM-dependent methyltransferase
MGLNGNIPAATSPRKLNYDADFFEVQSLDEARGFILGAELDLTVDQRWEAETPYLVDLISKNFKITADTVVLDYGCGVGRLSRELILKYGCRCVGVDTSASMRALAASYVDSPRFCAIGYDMLPLLGEGWAHLVIAVWILQHCARPREDLDRIMTARHSASINPSMFVLNELRLVPTREYGFVRDLEDIDALLKERLTLETGGSPDALIGKDLSERAWWGVYR